MYSSDDSSVRNQESVVPIAQKRKVISRGLIACLVVVFLIMLAGLTGYYLSNPIRTSTILYVIIGLSCVVALLILFWIFSPSMESRPSIREMNRR